MNYPTLISTYFIKKKENLTSLKTTHIDITGSQLELMLEKNEAKAQELTLTWIDKWNNLENQNLQNNTAKVIEMSPSVRSKQFSSGFMVEPDLPYIVALNDDPLLSDIRIYYIKQGDTILGNDEIDSHIGEYF